MDVTKLAVSTAEAARLYREYRDHRHSATPIDDEIRRVYREISRGKVVIRAIESIRAAGLGPDALPKLACADCPPQTRTNEKNQSPHALNS